jgi:N-glycosylase/DNA lyase
MNTKELKNAYEKKKALIKARLSEFNSLPEQEHYKEFMFCMLTPQSNAQRCWEAVEQIADLANFTDEKIKSILKTKTRFHNNKTNYLLHNRGQWNKIKLFLENQNIKELRNYLADNVKGYGLKEASHFLRNIGKSSNQIAILDRHILKNLKEFKAISEIKIKSRKDYFEKEEAFIKFSHKIGIPADELDLLWWSQENGEIFK